MVKRKDKKTKRIGLSKETQSHKSRMDEIDQFIKYLMPEAARLDEAAFNQLTDTMSSIVGIMKSISPKIATDKQLDKMTRKALGINFGKTPKAISSLSKNEKVSELKAVVNKMNLNPRPIQSRLVSKSAFILLCSYIEATIAELAVHYYHSFPDRLASGESQVSLQDLKRVGSIAAAEELIIEREVIKLTKGSISEQIRRVSNFLNIDSVEEIDPKNLILEMFERRNHVIHNQGQISDHYVRTIPADLVKRFELVKGKEVGISKDYFNACFQIGNSLGLKLLMTGWRKWYKSEKEPVETLLCAEALKALQSEKWILMDELIKFGSSWAWSNDSSRRVLMVNEALGLQHRKKEGEAKALIEAEDWSSCTYRFMTARYAVLGKKETMYTYLEKAIRNKEINSVNLKEWPLFNKYRADKKFKKLAGLANKNNKDKKKK